MNEHTTGITTSAGGVLLTERLVLLVEVLVGALGRTGLLDSILVMEGVSSSEASSAAVDELEE